MRIATASVLAATLALPAAARPPIISADHPLGVEAGLRILARGGNAIDAAIATQLALSVVDPGSAGLGGGTFLLYHDARTKRLHAIDARETAPAGASPEAFMRPDGKAMSQPEARSTGLSVGTPGTPLLLEVGHARFGRLPWKVLFEPAIELAEKGFPLSERLHRYLSIESVRWNDAGRAYFFGDDGRPKPQGTMLRNPELAATLKAIRDRGADAFYRGEIARDVVAAVRAHPIAPGTLSEEDLAGYRVRDVEPVCGRYRTRRVCGMPPSSSGGVALLQILGALERFDLASARPGSAEAVHLKAEAERLAFADRGRYLGDDRFVDVPISGLIDPAYVTARSNLIAREKSMGRAVAGTPAGVKVVLADDPHEEVMGTTHLNVVDRDGNAVAMTSTIEGIFGNGTMVRGFILNNELTDFTFVPVEGGVPVANAVGPGKRPRSSMTPTIVYDPDGSPELLAGSSGGSFIIGYVAKVVIATLDWNLHPQAAVALPNFGSRNGPTEIEQGTELEDVQASLRAMGHDVRPMRMTSGLQVVRRTRDGWQAGSDPRREGVARTGQ